ncbi:MAG: SURF1 family protein [Acidimicrobiia bacterium]
MRTLRRPIWLLGTVICLLVVVLFVELGFWQLRRLDTRRDHNELVSSRMAAAAVDVGELDRPGTDPDPASVEYRRVRVEGAWLPGSTVLVRSRALQGEPGFHVLGTLVLDPDGDRDGDSDGGSGPAPAVVVNRGFAPLGTGDADEVLPAVEPPAGPVELEGVLRRSETRGRIGPTDPAEGVLRVVNRVDVGRLQRQQPEAALAPLFVQQVLPRGAPGSLPVVLPLPDSSDEGSHLSYAGQWFLFAAVGLVGWPLLLRKVAREGDAADDGDGDGDPGADAGAVATGAGPGTVERV